MSEAIAVALIMSAPAIVGAVLVWQTRRRVGSPNGTASNVMEGVVTLAERLGVVADDTKGNTAAVVKLEGKVDTMGDEFVERCEVDDERYGELRNILNHCPQIDASRERAARAADAEQEAG